MSSEHPDLRLRAVLDPGVYVSAVLTEGPARDIIRAARAGKVTLVVSDALIGELDAVLHRDKFRRWLTVEEAEAFVEAVILLAEHAPDRSMVGREPVCRDPKDEYLIALAEDQSAIFLVSGDKDLLELRRGGVSVRSPREALEELSFQHPWGQGILPGRDDEAFRQAEAEGHSHVLELVLGFLAVVERPDATDVLPALVTPESLQFWVRDLAKVRQELADRGVASRPEYPSHDVAYVKLPRDPVQTLRAYTHKPLADAVIVTLQRRPELPDHLQVGGWRVHAVGDYVPSEQMPPTKGA